mgnify:CR=1 FL=1
MLSNFLKSYLRFWARRYLKRVKPKIIAVTGSTGKTSTKEAIFEVLKNAFGQQVRRSEGNLNTVYGVPLAILGFKKPPVPLDKPFSPWPWIPIIFAVPFKIWSNSSTKYLVLEIAADRPGDIKFTTTYLRPDMVVITNLGPAHLEIFGTVEKIIKEKIQLLYALSKDGLAFLNIDDETLKKIAERGEGNIKTFAIENNADITAKNITTEISENNDKIIKPLTKFQLVTHKTRFLAEIMTLGRQTNIYTALAAAAIGNILNLSREQILEGLKNIHPEKHRMEVLLGKNNSIIIDDTYNANPLSMKAALDTLKILPARRKIAVLGDMLELGKISQEAHKLIGQYAQEITDQVIGIGKLAKDYQANKYFENKQDAINYLLNELQKGDKMQGVPLILLKASRGIALEEVVEALRNK